MHSLVEPKHLPGASPPSEYLFLLILQDPHSICVMSGQRDKADIMLIRTQEFHNDITNVKKPQRAPVVSGI